MQRKCFPKRTNKPDYYKTIFCLLSDGRPLSALRLAPIYWKRVKGKVLRSSSRARMFPQGEIMTDTGVAIKRHLICVPV